MSPHETFLAHVARTVALDDAECAALKAVACVRQVRRKQYIVQPDFVCRHRTYVVSGLLHAYLVDDDGNAHTITFAQEDWWISDYQSFVYQSPATLFVEALEESVIIQLDHDDQEALLAAHPRLEHYVRVLTQRGLASMQQRLLANLSLSAEGRFDRFIERRGALMQRVPQYIIASYLGMTPEYFSKLRNRKAHK